MPTVTHRERVLAAAQHRQPDRVPLFYRDVPEVEERLLKDTGLRDREELLTFLKIDFRWVAPAYAGPPLGDPKTGTVQDVWGVRHDYTAFDAKNGYWEVTDPPLANCTDYRDLDSHPWPSVDWFDFSGLETQVKRYADYAIMTAPGFASPGVLMTIQNLMGIQKAWTDLLANQDLIRAMIDRIMDFIVPFSDAMLGAAGERIDFYRLGDDFGGQTGLLMRRELWRDMLQPPLSTLGALARRHGARYYHHTCGAIRELIPDLIETGVDVLDPVQVKARGMVPAELKREFGDRICFSGGVDEQELLPAGSPSQVREAVFELLDAMAPGGGFFIGPTHNLQVDIPTENILALYEAAHEWQE